MTRGTIGSRRRLTTLLAVPIAAAAAAVGIGHPLPALAASSTSSQVGYLTDAQNGGFSLWVDAFGIAAPADNTNYSTQSPAAALTVTIRNVSMTSLDTPSSSTLTSLNLDTLVMFSVCDIAKHPNAMKAINTWVDAGHKLVILDGATCTDTQGGDADWSTFIKPFSDNYIDPVPQQGTSTPYSFTGETGSNLTKGFPDCVTGATNGCEPGNALGDASVLSPNSPGWCTALAGTSANGVAGAVMGYTRTPSGTGFIAYEGEAFAWSVPFAQNKAHLRLAFDDTLTQAWNTDGLSCGRTAKSLALTPASDTKSVGTQETLTATVLDGAAPGTGVSGVTVTFKCVPGPSGSGPNVGLTGSAPTDGTGKATFQYTSATSSAIPDVWVASFTDTDNHKSNSAKVSWTPPVSVPETRAALLVPGIGVILMAGLLLFTLMRRRRRVNA